MQKDEFAVQELMRGECYRFLAACFYLPKKELFAAENLLANLTLSLQDICPDAAPFSRKMEESFARYTEEELAVEYARLFVGPFGLKAPPYGSIYLDNDRTVMGPSTMETISFYEKEGLARDVEFNELPDHIAVELEFMYFLIYKEVEALKKGDLELAKEYFNKQDDFCSRFLGKWVPKFCGEIKEGTENGFYSALADCVTAFVQAPALAQVNSVS